MLLQLVPTLISWVVVPTPLQYHATSHICQRPVARHARPVACAEGNENKGSLGRPLNPYVEALQNMSAPELVKRFAETAPPEVQQAVRATVISLMGNFPPHLYDTNVMTTGTNVASLMYSMQMTGYMFRNAQVHRIHSPAPSLLTLLASFFSLHLFLIRVGMVTLRRVARHQEGLSICGPRAHSTVVRFSSLSRLQSARRFSPV